MANGLPKIPESLETALKNGKVIPFVGSGISRMVQRNDSTGKPLFPSWRGYIEILAEALDNKGKSKAADYIRDCLNTKPPDYLEAMQIAFNQLGETVWDKLLDDHFDFEKKEAVENSLELPRLIWQLGSNLIITTNIDKVLQWSCLHPEEFKLLDIQKKEFGKLHKEVDPKCPTVIYLHGHIDNKANIIFTKEQYKLFYDFKVNEAKLETLKTLLTRRTFLFLGFSLDDPYFLQQIEYFHKLYDGGADSLFVVIHKNEKDNPNIPKFIGKVVFEGYGEPLLNLLKQLAIIAPKTTDIEISETNNLNSVISLNQANTTSNLSKTTEEELRDKIRKTNDTSDKTGDYQDSEIFSTQQSKTFKNRLQKSLLITLVCLLITVGLGYCFFNNQPTKTMPIDSIAVLPLQNESLDPDTEYLANGLTRDLIFRLAQLPNIKVSPTSSVIRYKGKETDTKKIANDLSVNAVMSGGIVKRGESLIISVELEDVRNNKVIWGKRYERKMSELLATQQEITTEIIQKLQLKLSGEETKVLTKKYTDNNEAYRLYIEGREKFARRTKGDMLDGIGNFQQAIQLDPNFALAYVGIADSYNVMPSNAYMSPKESIPKAKAAARRALEIDQNLAEAHSALANSLVVYDWDWIQAEAEFKRAIELNPNVANNHFYYGILYCTPLGRHDEAIAELEKAVKLEPYTLIISANLAGAYMYAGQYGKALEQAKKTYEDNPNFWGGQIWLAQVYNANGMYDEAIATIEKTIQADPTNQIYLRIPGYAHAKSGRRREAKNMIKKLREIGSKTKYIMTYRIASIYAALGDKNRAFAELENSFKERDWDLHRLKVDPFMASLRDDPRFKEMLKRLNLPA